MGAWRAGRRNSRYVARQRARAVGHDVRREGLAWAMVGGVAGRLSGCERKGERWIDSSGWGR